MKLKPQNQSSPLPRSVSDVVETATEVWVHYRGKKLPIYLFLAFCFNLIAAPVVLAASRDELSRSQAWAIGLLGLGIVALAIYLFFVMFAPEKF